MSAGALRAWAPRLLGLTCAIAAAGGQALHAEPANRIIALVNDEPITEGDLNDHLQALLGRLESADAGAIGEPTAEMRRGVLERLIQQRLIVQEAGRLGVAVPSEDVIGDLRRLQEVLGPEGYAKMLGATGLNEEQLKRKIREQLLIRRAIDQVVRPRVSVGPAEVARRAGALASEGAVGEEVDAWHILVRVTDARSEDEAREMTQRLSEDLLKARDAEQRLQQLSEGTLEGVEAGRLGWVRQGTLLPELDAALFGQEAGTLSGPIRTRLGFHLVKVLERRRLSEAEVFGRRKDIEQQIYREKFEDALAEWIRGLADRAYVEILEP